MTTNQVLIDALRERAAEKASKGLTVSLLLQLAQAPALCRLTEDHVDVEERAIKNREMLSNALRAHAAALAQTDMISDLRQLAKVAALYRLADDRVSVDNRELLLALVRQDADASPE